MATVRLTTIAIALCGALGVALPGVASASSISGTVTAEGGGPPIQGVEVCPRPEPYSFEAGCVETGPGGEYKLDGLPGSDYILRFSADTANLKYVSEFYDDKINFFEADLFHLGSAEDRDLDVELAEGGSIGGNVTDESTGLPIAGVSACANRAEVFFPGRCAITGPTGDYQINGLPSGTYHVEYAGENRVNYLREFYEDAETVGTATDVAVTAPTLTPDIDAKLAPGAQILGHVSQIGTGTALEDVMVCANEQDPGEYQACDWTDAAGDYAIRSIPAGTYLVSFDVEYAPFSAFQIFGEWWQGAPTVATAAPISIAPPETRTGIDGHLPDRYPKPKPEPIQVSLIPRPQLPNPPKKCKKGFHKKKVKGKVRCVRKHKRHGQGHRKGAKSKP